MGILDNMMKGYSDRVLGPQQADPQIASDQLSSAYQKIQDTLKNNRDTQRNSHALDTNPDKGEYQEVSELQRWRNQIDAMITSSNPQLQKEGMAQLQAYQQKNTAVPTAPKTSSAHTMAVELGYKPGSESYRNFILGQANKSSGSDITIKMGESDEAIPFSDFRNLVDKDNNPLPFGVTYKEAKNLGAKINTKAVAGDTAGKQSMLEVSSQQFPIIQSNMFDENGNVDREMINYISAIDNIPIGGNLAAKYLNPKAQEVYNAFETGMQAITRTETGAAMPPEEVQNTKTRFMPGPTDTDAVIKQKWNAFQYFINNANELLAPTGGVDPSAVMEAAVQKALKEGGVATKAKPASTQHKAGDTWSDGTYEYRVNSEGKTQRRAK